MAKRLDVLRASLKASLAAGVLMMASASSAEAQFFGFRDDYGYSEPYSFWGPHYRRPPIVLDELQPSEIIGGLQARGFTRVSRPVYDEDVAIVRALNPNGRPVRLTIDIYSGRIIDREVAPPERRPQVVQRAPGQGPAIRETTPETKTPARVAPEASPEIRRQPVTPRQATPPAPPRNERIVRPEKPAPAARPPEANVGTKQQPRRIEIAPPPAPLDAPEPAAPRAPEAPINSVPPAPLE